MIQLGLDLSRQGNKEILDTYEIIEQIFLFSPFLLPYNHPLMTGFSHGFQVICTTRN